MARTTTRCADHTQWKCTKFLMPIDNCDTTMSIDTKKWIICGCARAGRNVDALDAAGTKLGTLVMVDSKGEDTWDYI
ncbi:hypothetical protein Forpe1208_v000196 [Fusarium oxysporum f. sp. rapae]|uniref:Uncharacterized protein n=1 Tax=Fusarium oxysporum f. sp. rapae TaxID=485398 RepID=A0A8J5PIR1_FUSOX|nr:hypothetical protein Forpe1208_v000196 [Fusarium oxysporum f. sp. rapae]